MRFKRVRTMKEITTKVLLEMILVNDSYHGLHEDLAHVQGQITKTDEAIHTRNLWRAGEMRKDPKASKMKFIPYKFPPSRIEDEFAEWRHLEKEAV